MFSQRHWPSLLGAFFSLIFSTVALSQQYPDHASSIKDSSNVRVIWLSPIEVNDTCWEFSQKVPDGVILGCYVPATNTIYAPEPRSFNDHKRLETLGHEYWHALGAEHP